MDLNIICLHGFTQNSVIFQKKLSKLIKNNGPIKLYFLDGSVLLPGENEPRAYWIYDQNNPLNVEYDFYDANTKIYSLEKSFELFLELAKKIGKVDGIIGFSQGGAFADYICNMFAAGKIPYDIRFAIFIAARPFQNRTSKIKIIKTLHMYGTNDTVVPNQQSIELSQMCENTSSLVHNGQHIVPSNSDAKTAIKNFLMQFL